MSQQYDNKNTFALFKNERKQSEKHPDYTGTLTDENGVEWFCDAWIREGKKGKFMSGRIKRKEKQGGGGSAPSGGWANDLDDSVPFAPEWR